MLKSALAGGDSGNDDVGGRGGGHVKTHTKNGKLGEISKTKTKKMAR